MLHTQYGHHLFAKGDFEEALAHFGMCSHANPVVLLRLFPSLVSRQLLDPLLPTVSGASLTAIVH